MPTTDSLPSDPSKPENNGVNRSRKRRIGRSVAPKNSGKADGSTDESSDASPAPLASGSGTKPTDKRKAKERPQPPNPIKQFLALAQNNGSEEDLKSAISAILSAVVAKSPISNKYNLLFLSADRSLARFDADQIYKAVSQFKEKRPILITVWSHGGSIEAAYLISKLCREYSKGEFAVAVPREAKSAATLLCCGAEHVHMGSLSELGPIDPQIDGMPALALKYSIQHLFELARANRGAAETIAAYLAKSLNIQQVGYYERIAESATQYAERLLKSRRTGPEGRKPSDIADRLVYHYKDHGFVIDAAEAADIFGNEMVVLNSPEYDFSNEIYQHMSFIKYFVNDVWNGQLSIAGSVDSGLFLFKKPAESK